MSSTNNRENTQSGEYWNFLAETQGKVIDLHMWALSAAEVLPQMAPPGVVLQGEELALARVKAGRLEIYMKKLEEGLRDVMKALAKELARHPQPAAPEPGTEQP